MKFRTVPNIFFEVANNSARFTEYWTHKHAVVSLNEMLQQQQHFANFFPAPICFDKEN